ncbi:MAG: HIT family protein [Solirubrobacterales bacterium]
MPEAGCPFCAIVAGEAEATVVLSEPGAVAFLDNRPLFPGHCLLVPTEHRETLLDLADAEVGPFFAAARRLAAAVTDAMEAQGTFVALNNVVSQSVPHLHVHVVPRRRRDGLRGFFWPRARYSSAAEMAEVGGRIAAALRA